MVVYVGYVVYEMKQQNNMSSLGVCSNLVSFILSEYEKHKKPIISRIIHFIAARVETLE